MTAALPARLRTALDIYPGEDSLTVLVVGIMLLTSAGFTLGSKGIETLFYTRFGVQYLPYMFLLSGVLSVIISIGMTGLLGRVRQDHLYIFLPILVAGLTILAWLMLFSTWTLVYPILWLGKEIINTLITLVVWGVASSVTNTRQSKRLFPLFSAGRILGSVIGGFGTGPLVDLIGTQNLLLVWTSLLLLAFLLTRALVSKPAPIEPSRPSRRKPKQVSFLGELRGGFQFVRGSSLLMLIAISSILFSILYRCIELPFAQAATTRFFGDEKSLAGFLGLFDGLSTSAAFLASTFLANRLYVRFGIMNALLALPVIYLVGFGSTLLLNTFVVIIVFRFVQMLWLSGIADSSYQAIFNPIPPARRDQVRAFLGGVPGQIGTLLAGVITLLLAAQQLALIGLITAIATTLLIWQAGRAYNQSLLEALRKGRPHLFGPESRPDASAIRASLDGLQNPDPLVRRISVDLVGRTDGPTAMDALVGALNDQDLEVRLSALRSLARQHAATALLEIASLLSAPQPGLRAQAVDTLRQLTPYPHGLALMLAPLLADENPQVRIRVILALLSADPTHPSRAQLRQMTRLGDGFQRSLAIHALAEIHDEQTFAISLQELMNAGNPLPVRSAAAAALGSCGAVAIPVLIGVLGGEQAVLKKNAASALGEIGEPALLPVLQALSESSTEDGALQALEQLPAWKEKARILDYVKLRVTSSLHFENLRLALPTAENERLQLLADSLQSRARHNGLQALAALGLLSDRPTIATAIENLQSRQQVSDAIETLESIHSAVLIRPLFRVWESQPDTSPKMNLEQALNVLMTEKDDWLRACAQFAKDGPMETLTTLSPMERVLLLRRVALLADLAPLELQHIAAIATEHDFVDGDLICEQGEQGNELYVIVTGEARVTVSHPGADDTEIARRKAGDYVGEMSLISGDIRIASVIASGDVRALCLDRLNFESLLRERPEVSLAVMRELCHRLKERS